MRILIAVLTASLPLTASSAAPAPEAARQPHPRTGFAQQGEQCEKFEVQHAIGNTPTRSNKLGELPPGKLQLAVMRKVDDCWVPTIVRQGYGGR